MDVLQTDCPLGNPHFVRETSRCNRSRRVGPLGTPDQTPDQDSWRASGERRLCNNSPLAPGGGRIFAQDRCDAAQDAQNLLYDALRLNRPEISGLRRRLLRAQPPVRVTSPREPALRPAASRHRGRRYSLAAAGTGLTSTRHGVDSLMVAAKPITDDFAAGHW
jgi:hypothetical protein